MTTKIITLTTDFGTGDGYDAAMKGVILGICPGARLVDVTHTIPPRDIRSGAFVLAGVHPFFPEGTIHLAVVDPGVGTDRRAVAIRTARSLLVGPDNGLFSWILKKEGFLEARVLKNRDFWLPVVSNTFHGRDIFAPVAAHLASGVPFEELGPVCVPLTATWTEIVRTERELRGEIIHIDRFGNAVSNITRQDLESFAPAEHCLLRVGPHSIHGLSRTYGRVPGGHVLALIGSSELLEIAIHLGNASSDLPVRVGDSIAITRDG